jgi:hypothetical protein
VRVVSVCVVPCESQKREKNAKMGLQRSMLGMRSQTKIDGSRVDFDCCLQS